MESLRVQVILDVSTPLSRGCKVWLEQGNLGWVSFNKKGCPTSVIGVDELLMVINTLCGVSQEQRFRQCGATSIWGWVTFVS